MRVGLDVDDVVADLLHTWIKEYNALWDDTMTVNDMDRWALHEIVKPECGDKIYGLVNSGLYLKVAPFPGALNAVDHIRAMGHEVIFVTHCINNTEKAKQDWLRRWYFLPKDQGFLTGNLISTPDKSRAPVDVLVDDNVKNVESFLGWSLLQSRPHNLKSTTNKQRISHLSEFVEILRHRAA